MVALRAGLAVASGTLGAIYAVGQASNNRHYWASYSRRTGVHVKYPYRSGVHDYMKYASQAMGYGSMAFNSRRWKN